MRWSRSASRSIYNASHVINFAQGEFVMIGGMATVFLAAAGLPLPLAALGAIALAVAVGLAIERFGVRPARGASVITLIIITIGASIFLRGLAGVLLDKNFHSLPAFSGEQPLRIGGATLLPQSLWVLGTMLAGGAAALAVLPLQPDRQGDARRAPTTRSPRSWSASTRASSCG